MAFSHSLSHTQNSVYTTGSHIVTIYPIHSDATLGVCVFLVTTNGEGIN